MTMKAVSQKRSWQHWPSPPGAVPRPRVQKPAPKLKPWYRTRRVPQKIDYGTRRAETCPEIETVVSNKEVVPRRPAAPSTTSSPPETEAPATSEEEQLLEGAAPQVILVDGELPSIIPTESYRHASELIGPSSTLLRHPDGSMLVPYADDADGEV